MVSSRASLRVVVALATLAVLASLLRLPPFTPEPAHAADAPVVTNRSPVTVSFTCAPAGAPLIGLCPAPVLLSDGASQSLTPTVSAEDSGSAAKPRCVGRDPLSGLGACGLGVRREWRPHALVLHVTAVATDRAGNRATARKTFRVPR